MQTTHPRRKLHPGVILVNGSLLLGGVLFIVAMFGNWLEGPRLAGGPCLLLGLGFVAEGIMRHIGWLAEREKPKQLGVAWLIVFGACISVAGILMLFGY